MITRALHRAPHSIRTVSKWADSAVKKQVVAAGRGHYVLATGNCSDKGNTRNLLMKVTKAELAAHHDKFKPQLMTDSMMQDNEKDDKIELLHNMPSVSLLSEGEVDCVGKAEWSYGYVMSPYFVLFNKDQALIKQHETTRDCFYLQSRPSCIFGQRIWAEDVESVYVRLGERPWLTREIGIRLDDVQHTIFSYNVPCNGLESGDMEVQPSYEQLAQLMLDTDWLVKAAAQLSYVLSASRIEADTRPNIPLYLPRVRKGTMSSWVKLKDSLWNKRLSYKLEQSRVFYTP